MQREYQICAPDVFDGMAIAFTKEVLRVVQDTFSIHEAL